MAENQEIDLDAWQKLDLLHDEASNEGMRAIRYFAHKLHEAQSNPHLRVAVQGQLRSNNLLSPAPEEGIYSLERQETLALGRRNSTHEELKSPLRDEGGRTMILAMATKIMKMGVKRTVVGSLTKRCLQDDVVQIAQQRDIVLVPAIALPLLAIGVVKEET